jgi:hypothetical protein
MLQKNKKIVVIKSNQVNDVVHNLNYRLRRSLQTKLKLDQFEIAKIES